eukprot:jgi/Mesvir1/26720/Mv20497-RA.1
MTAENNPDSIIQKAFEQNIVPTYMTPGKGVYGEKSGHVVEEGETWKSIADQYGVLPDDLIIANPHISPLALAPGSFVLIPKRYSFHDFVNGVIHPDTNMGMTYDSIGDDVGSVGGGSGKLGWSLRALASGLTGAAKSGINYLRSGVNSREKALWLASAAARPVMNAINVGLQAQGGVGDRIGAGLSSINVNDAMNFANQFAANASGDVYRMRGAGVAPMLGNIAGLAGHAPEIMQGTRMAAYAPYMQRGAEALGVGYNMASSPYGRVALRAMSNVPSRYYGAKPGQGWKDVRMGAMNDIGGLVGGALIDGGFNQYLAPYFNGYGYGIPEWVARQGVHGMARGMAGRMVGSYTPEADKRRGMISNMWDAQMNAAAMNEYMNPGSWNPDATLGDMFGWNQGPVPNDDEAFYSMLDPEEVLRFKKHPKMEDWKRMQASLSPDQRMALDTLYDQRVAAQKTLADASKNNNGWFYNTDEYNKARTNLGRVNELMTSWNEPTGPGFNVKSYARLRDQVMGRRPYEGWRYYG